MISDNIVSFNTLNSKPFVEILKTKLSSKYLVAALQRRGIIGFVFQTCLNTFLLIIGIVTPLYILAGIFFTLGFSTLNPQINHFVISSLVCLPIGALFVLFGIRNGGRWFGTIMAHLFAYGVFLPIIISAIISIIIRILLGFFLSESNIALISSSIFLTVTIMSLIYGIIRARDSGPLEKLKNENEDPVVNTNSSPMAVISVMDEVIDGSTDDSDSGDND